MGLSAPVAVQTFWFSYSQVSGLSVPDVHATGRCTVMSGMSVCHAMHSSWSKANTLPGPVEVSIMLLLFLSTQNSGRAQIFVNPVMRLAMATAWPSMLTEVRDGLPWASGRVW
jgi:hypothetical protein